MFGFGEAEEAHNQAYDNNGEPNNEASFSHEALGGAAAFMAMRQYEKHEEANGKPESHQLAKELIAGFAGAEADKLVETKGEDFYDREKVKHQAKENAENYYDQKYQGGGGGGSRDGGYGGGDGGYGGQQGGGYGGGDRGDDRYGQQSSGY